jgi:hypothetical protein
MQGRIYRISAEDKQLTVQARERGTILEIQGDTVISECLTGADLSRFQAEVLRIRQQVSKETLRLVHPSSQLFER